eukprot:3519399-Amphidinium_carterae.1
MPLSKLRLQRCFVNKQNWASLTLEGNGSRSQAHAPYQMLSPKTLSLKEGLLASRNACARLCASKRPIC